MYINQPMEVFGYYQLEALEVELFDKSASYLTPVASE